MMIRKVVKTAAKVALSAVTLIFSVITIAIAAPIGLFESFRANWTRRKRTPDRNRTSKWKVLSFWHTFNSPVYVPVHEREVIQMGSSSRLGRASG